MTLPAPSSPATADEAAALARVRAALTGRADRDGLLDVSYRIVDSPVGALLLAGSPAGLLRVAYAREDHDAVLGRIADQISPRILLAPGRLDPVARQLDEYFAQHRRRFDLPIDLRLSRGFRREVLEHLNDIGYGHTTSYAEVAARVQRPKAVRAVGTACASNPLPIVLPCHRVIRSDGTRGAYVGGAETKLTLLALEASGGRGEGPGA